jgi:predicted amidophosphoribosyltransferase
MPKYSPLQRRQPSQRSIPTCHHCGKIGNTQSSCFKLRPHEHKYDSYYSMKSYEGICNMMRDVLTRLDKLDLSHNTAPSIKKAWVRKVDTINSLRGSGSGLT